MFKSDNEVSDLLNHQNNNACTVKIIGNGQDDRIDRRPKSDTREHLSTEQKANIAILAGIIGVKSTAEMVEKIPSTVSKIRRGLNGVDIPDQKLRAVVDSKKSEIQEKALDKATLFLDMLGLEGDLSDNFKRAAIAEKVVNIYEKLIPKTPPPIGGNTNIVFYAPKLLETKDYPTIEVEAQNG